MAPTEDGVTDQLRRLSTAFLNSMEHRLHLFGIELQEEKIRFLQLFVIAVAGCVSALMALVAMLALIFWLLPPGGRTPFLIVVVLGSIVASWLAFRSLNQKFSEAQFFSATRTELQKDRQCLEIRS